jgi:hypothetical protein
LSTPSLNGAEKNDDHVLFEEEEEEDIAGTKVARRCPEVRRVLDCRERREGGWKR